MNEDNRITKYFASQIPSRREEEMDVRKVSAPAAATTKAAALPTAAAAAAPLAVDSIAAGKSAAGRILAQRLISKTENTGTELIC